MFNTNTAGTSTSTKHRMMNGGVGRASESNTIYHIILDVTSGDVPFGRRFLYRYDNQFFGEHSPKKKQLIGKWVDTVTTVLEYLYIPVLRTRTKTIGMLIKWNFPTLILWWFTLMIVVAHGAEEEHPVVMVVNDDNHNHIALHHDDDDDIHRRNRNTKYLIGVIESCSG